MTDATYVAYVPASLRGKLREALQDGEAEGLRWSERRKWRGSEFYFSGAPGLVRKTHQFVVEWALRAK